MSPSSTNLRAVKWSDCGFLAIFLFWHMLLIRDISKLITYIIPCFLFYQSFTISILIQTNQREMWKIFQTWKFKSNPNFYQPQTREGVGEQKIIPSKSSWHNVGLLETYVYVLQTATTFLSKAKCSTVGISANAFFVVIYWLSVVLIFRN